MMAAPALIPILKKIAVYVVTDKKLLKTVCGIVIGIIFIILMPLIAIFSIASGEIEIDTAYLQSAIEANITEDETAALQGMEEDIALIQTKMTEAGYDDSKIRKAEVLYVLALYDGSEHEGAIDDLVDCFSEAQDDAELIYAVNLRFGTDISVSAFEKIMEKIEDESSADENLT